MMEKYCGPTDEAYQELLLENEKLREEIRALMKRLGPTRRLVGRPPMLVVPAKYRTQESEQLELFTGGERYHGI